MPVVHHHARRLRLLLEDLQQGEPGNRPALHRQADLDGSFRLHDDLVLMLLRGRTKGLVGSDICITQLLKTGVRQHHTEAEGSVRSVLLDDFHLPVRRTALEQQAEIKTGRTAAHNRHFHHCSPRLICNRWRSNSVTSPTKPPVSAAFHSAGTKPSFLRSNTRASLAVIFQ
ncbi:hypothetical protein D9M69_483660 [compost metagenome]